MGKISFKFNFKRLFYHLSGLEINTGFRSNMADKGVDKGADKGVELGYVGIDAILEQMRRKAMKQGFELNIMVVGE